MGNAFVRCLPCLPRLNAFVRCLPCLPCLPHRNDCAPQPEIPDERGPQTVAFTGESQDQLDTFVRDGLLILQIPEREVAASVHQSIYRRAAKMGFGGKGDNILPEILELDQVITAKTVTEALEVLLGPGNRLHRHRWLHVSATQGDQSWHKDGNDLRMRNHRTRWLKVMYYPQDTVVEMGPTAVLPGSQYVTVDQRPGSAEAVLPDGTRGFFWKPRSEEEVAKAKSARAEAAKSLDPSLKERFVLPLKAGSFVLMKAGSVVLMHDDLIHRGTRDSRGENKQVQEPRCMIKFQFFRVHDPQPDSLAALRADGFERMKPVHQEMLRWHGARISGPAPAVSRVELESLKVDLRSDSEPARIAAAYSLGIVARRTDMPDFREEALTCFAEAMRSGRESARRAASFGFMTAGPQGVELAVEMLEQIPEGARKYLLWSLGEAGVASEEVVNCVVRALAEKTDDWYDMAILEKAAAVSALGLLGARAEQDDIFFKICEVLITAAGNDAEPDFDRCQFLVREAAAFALLQVCAAAPAMAAAQDRVQAPAMAAAQDRVQESLVKLLDDEDRYALGFAAEALRTLADKGFLRAEQALRNLFAEELADEEGTDLARLVRCQRQKI